MSKDKEQIIDSITVCSTFEEVTEYIKHLKLSKHRFEDVAKHFTNECVDGRVFLNLEKSDLNTLGVVQLSRRNALYDHIVALREKEVNKSYSDTNNITFAKPKQNIGRKLPMLSPISLFQPLSTIPGSQSSTESISMQFANIMSSLPTMTYSFLNNSASYDIPTTPIPKIKSIETLSSALGHGIETEKCPYSTIQSGADCIKFIAVYRGVNTKKEVFVLMDNDGIRTFNKIAMQWGIHSKQKQQNVKFCVLDSPSQTFNSCLYINKLHTGWTIQGTKLPFNPICVCTYNLRKDELISMLPMDVCGYVNNIDCRGLIWVVSQLRVAAFEKRTKQSDEGRTGLIDSISFDDNRNGQFRNRDVSYLVHDWTDYHFDADINEKVTVCMKLSTKTNQKTAKSVSDRRAVFIQVWNLRNGVNEYEKTKNESNPVPFEQSVPNTLNPFQQNMMPYLQQPMYINPALMQMHCPIQQQPNMMNYNYALPVTPTAMFNFANVPKTKEQEQKQK